MSWMSKCVWRPAGSSTTQPSPAGTNPNQASPAPITFIPASASISKRTRSTSGKATSSQGVLLPPRPEVGRKQQKRKKDTSTHVSHVDLEVDDPDEVDPLFFFCQKWVSAGTARSLAGLPLGEKLARAATTFAEVYLLIPF